MAETPQPLTLQDLPSGLTTKLLCLSSPVFFPRVLKAVRDYNSGSGEDYDPIAVAHALDANEFFNVQAIPTPKALAAQEAESADTIYGAAGDTTAAVSEAARSKIHVDWQENGRTLTLQRVPDSLSATNIAWALHAYISHALLRTNDLTVEEEAGFYLHDDSSNRDLCELRISQLEQAGGWQIIFDPIGQPFYATDISGVMDRTDTKKNILYWLGKAAENLVDNTAIPVGEPAEVGEVTEAQAPPLQLNWVKLKQRLILNNVPEGLTDRQMAQVFVDFVNERLVLKDGNETVSLVSQPPYGWCMQLGDETPINWALLITQEGDSCEINIPAANDQNPVGRTILNDLEHHLEVCTEVLQHHLERILNELPATLEATWFANQHRLELSGVPDGLEAEQVERALVAHLREQTGILIFSKIAGANVIIREDDRGEFVARFRAEHGPATGDWTVRFGDIDLPKVGSTLDDCSAALFEHLKLQPHLETVKGFFIDASDEGRHELALDIEAGRAQPALEALERLLGQAFPRPQYSVTRDDDFNKDNDNVNIIISSADSSSVTINVYWGDDFGYHSLCLNCDDSLNPSLAEKIKTRIFHSLADLFSWRRR